MASASPTKAKAQQLSCNHTFSRDAKSRADTIRYLDSPRRLVLWFLSVAGRRCLVEDREREVEVGKVYLNDGCVTGLPRIHAPNMAALAPAKAGRRSIKHPVHFYHTETSPSKDFRFTDHAEQDKSWISNKHILSVGQVVVVFFADGDVPSALMQVPLPG